MNLEPGTAQLLISDLLQLPVMVTRLFWMLLLLNANSQCVWGWILPAAGKLILEFIRISEELCKWMQASSELLYNWLLSFHKLMLCYFLSASGAQTEPKETYRCVSFTGLCTVKKKDFFGWGIGRVQLAFPATF